MSMLSKLNEDLNRQMDQPAQKHPLRWWHIPLLLLLVAGTVFVIVRGDRKTATAVHGQKQYLKCEGAVFGTFYHITYEAEADMQDSIDAVLQRIDSSLSPFNKQSVITAINQNESMTTDADFRRVFSLAQTISAATDGAFDITVAPLVNAWGFGFRNKADITDALIDSLLVHVGMNLVAIDEQGMVVKADTAVMLDCSAIAKGYGVDAVADMLQAHGVDNYMVEIGGEVRLKGYNPKGKLWSIGIVKPDPDPTGQNQELEEVLTITDIAMATSGNYRNYYEEGNRRYAHTIDPRTGWPVQHNILSSTVLAPDCATADAYATAFMVLGLEQAQAVLDRHPELRAYFIYADEQGNNAVWRKGM